MTLFKPFYHRLLAFSFTGILLLYAAAASVPFLDQDAFWFISIVGIIFPWLFFIVIAGMIFLIVKKSRWTLMVLTLLFLSCKSVFSTFGFNYFKRIPDFDSGKEGIRLLSWNVSRWDQMKSIDQLPASNRDFMLNQILLENADIMCFHEFFEPAGDGLKFFQSNIDAIRAQGYSYYSFFPTSKIHNLTKQFGMAIFSRYPIVDSANYSFGKAIHSEGLMSADIRVNNQIIRILTTHLETFKIGKVSYFGSTENGLLSKAQTSATSIRHAYRKRDLQMHLVKEQISLSPYPVILLGNLGDVPNSRTYSVLAKDLDDAFLAIGSGFGATFRGISPNLRLDYILVDKNIQISNFKISKSLYSDHYPILADVSFQ